MTDQPWNPWVADSCRGFSKYVPANSNPVLPYDSTNPAPVIFYNDHFCTHGGGGSFSYTVGSSIHDLGTGGKNDLVSSIAVPPNVVLEVWRDANFTGAYKRLGPGVYPDLGQVRYDTHPNDHLDDNITSFRVSSLMPHNEWLNDCCFNRNGDPACGSHGQIYSQECQAQLFPVCSKTDLFFGSPQCHTYFQNYPSAAKTEVAKRICQATPANKWCACLQTANYPASLTSDPKVAAMLPCLDPVCNDATASLQPFDKKCAPASTICAMPAVRAHLGTTDANSIIMNACSGPMPTLPPHSPVPGVAQSVNVAGTWNVVGARSQKDTASTTSGLYFTYTDVPPTFGTVTVMDNGGNQIVVQVMAKPYLMTVQQRVGNTLRASDPAARVAFSTDDGVNASFSEEVNGRFHNHDLTRAVTTAPPMPPASAPMPLASAPLMPTDIPMPPAIVAAPTDISTPAAGPVAGAPPADTTAPVTPRPATTPAQARRRQMRFWRRRGAQVSAHSPARWVVILLLLLAIGGLVYFTSRK